MSHVLVAGAGIAGVTTALSLHAAGIDSAVVDPVRELSPLGVGINLQPAAVRELTELGLGDELAGLAVAITGCVHTDRHGNRIWAEPRGMAAGYRWPQYAVHRGELQQVLLRAVRERLGDGAVRTGTAVVGFTEDSDAVHVQLRDRATGATWTEPAGALVGADGLHSTVRALLHPGEGAPIGNGIRMWRGTVVTEPYLDGSTMVVAGCNTWSKFVAYPIGRRGDRALINWVAEVSDPDGDIAADWTRRGQLDDVLPHFADWRYGWLDVPGLIAATDRILEYPMVDRDPLPHWGTARVMLAGDAAHPMYPIGSNGGSQAILDGRVLALCLSRSGLPAGVSDYEKERRETTNAILLANRRMGPESVLRTVAERAPDGFTDIAEVLTADELAAITTAYHHTTGTDVTALNARASLSPDVAEA